MARYNGRLHCIVGVLPTCYKRKAATYFYPRVARGVTARSGGFERKVVEGKSDKIEKEGNEGEGSTSTDTATEIEPNSKKRRTE